MLHHLFAPLLFRSRWLEAFKEMDDDLQLDEFLKHFPSVSKEAKQVNMVLFWENVS